VSLTQGPEPLRVEQAWRLLPEVDALEPLRASILSLSSPRPPEAWTAAEPNRTIGKRSFDPQELRAAVPQAVASAGEHLTALYTAAVDALGAEHAGDSPGAVAALLRGGDREERAERTVQARAWYQHALKIAEGLGHRGPEARVLLHLGHLEAERGYLDEAGMLYQRSLALAEAESFKELAARAAAGLGDVAMTLAQWVGAESWYARGLKYAEGDPSLTGNLLLGLGEAAFNRGRFSDGVERLRRALELFESVGNADGSVRVLVAGGRMAAAQSHAAAALACYRDALSRLPATGRDPRLEVAIRLGLSELYLDLGRMPDAEDEARRGEVVAMTHRLPRQLAQVYMALGKLRGRQRDEDGFVFFEQATELCRMREPLPRLEAEVCREYARFRSLLGEHQEARLCLERAREIMEPFVDEIALERIDRDLKHLDDDMLGDSASQAG
jgi:tetratricopeptide (TPR) repeat protein